MQLEELPVKLNDHSDTKSISDHATTLQLRGGEFQAMNSSLITRTRAFTLNAETPQPYLALGFSRVGYRVTFTDVDDKQYNAILQMLAVTNDPLPKVAINLIILSELGHLLLEEGGYLLLEEGGRIIL